MHTDEDLIGQLKASFEASTRSISTNPDLPAAIRGRLRRRRISRTAIAGVSALAVFGFVVSSSAFSPGHRGHLTPADRSAYLPSGSPATPGPIRLLSVSQVLDAAAAASLPLVGPGEYRHTRTTSYSMRQIVGARIVDIFSTTDSDLWVPSEAKGVSFQRTSSNDTVHYLDPADRSYLEQNAPGGAPKHDVAWYAGRGDQPSVEIYPAVDQPARVVTTPQVSLATTAWDDSSTQNLERLPREPVALRASVYAYASSQATEATKAGKSYTADDAAFDAVSGAVASPNATPDLRAALYAVAKTIPGIKLIGKMTNYTGVSGIAIGRVTQTTGIERDLIFNASTVLLIGERSITVRATDQSPGTQGQPTLAAGTIILASGISTDVTGKPVLPAGAKAPR